MNYKKINILENSILLISNTKNLLVKSIKEQQSLICFNSSFTKIWTYPIKESTGQFIDYDSDTFIYYQNFNSDFILKDTGELTRKESKIYLESNKYYNVFINLSDESKIIIQSKKDISSIDYTNSSKIFSKNFIIQTSLRKKKIYVNSILKEGHELWNKSYQSFLNIHNANLYGNPLLIENRLFIYLFDSSRQTDKSATFCLSPETGEILWKSEEFGGWITTFNNKIYSINNKTIKILAPDTFNIETIDLSKELSILDKKVYDEVTNANYVNTFLFSNSVYSIVNEKLYFCQEKNNIVGVINLDEKKLEWYTEVYIKNNINPSIKDIQVNENRFYVTDQADTLHIFEKEQSSS